jgi:DNA-binding CsgD family transcriptional regulator
MRDDHSPTRPAGILPAAAAFGLFVFWLLALPMEGPLLVHSASDRHIFQFLLPHVAGLFLIGRFWPAATFPLDSRLAVFVTIGLTTVFPLLPEGEGWFLAACGISSAFISIRAGLLLKQSLHPLSAAAGGLLLGNLLLFLLPQLHLPQVANHLLVAASLSALLIPAAPATAGPTGDLTRYLPAIFIFQLVSGLMYRFLMPAYVDLAYWNGIEITFYLAAVGLALWLLRRDRELLLVCGVVLGLLAFLCLRGNDRATFNLAMFGMQGAAGCVDMFLISVMLGGSNAQRAFGSGNSVLCGGILAGAVCNLLLGNLAGSAIVVSQLALNGAVLLLYLQNRRPSKAELPNIPPMELSDAPLPLHPDIRILLSEQEQQVLELVRQGKTYREAAGLLGISESSIKTYMTRICGKLGATNKRALLSTLAEKHPPSSILAEK